MTAKISQPWFGEPGASAAPAAGARARLVSIDLLRGVVMVLMTLDHCRDYLHQSAFDPRDTGQPALFLTRWITHFCAPTFIFLAGVSAFLHGQRQQSPARLSRFLWTRGLWLVALELSLVRIGWTFDVVPRLVLLQVIWALGVSMLALAALVHLPRPAIAVFAVASIAGHNALDGVVASTFGEASWAWTLLHGSDVVVGPGGISLWLLYPLVPWLGVMAGGYALGPLFHLEAARRRRALVALGFGLLAAFALLRATNLYGNPTPWVPRAGTIQSALAFIDCEKYPPSLSFLCMTLGPALLLLAAFDRASQRGAALWLATIGSVPLFYYLAHIYAVHGISVLVSLLSLGTAAPVLGHFPPDKPAGFGLSLPVVYALTLLLVIVLALASRAYSGLKRRRHEWWWSYL
ncbi:MAG TPA: heparan-alpha-glucosaminide N-acetyltransferase domain-containing protein [Polyangiaceae bacterium]|jgi:uncharacterized membrane protein|nr:heparan-alpha-glucosaminide N-acetyltransferase domain-containing protein [Polyangiaceae bacterium]